MKAMILNRISGLDGRSNPLILTEVPVPVPQTQEVLVKISVCGVCHTEIDEIEGRTRPPVLPVIPGHEIVGTVEQCGDNAKQFSVGDRVGIGWINRACGECAACRRGFENLCKDFVATGRDAPGGYAEYTTVHEAYAFGIPDTLSDAEAAPLLCAGAIGYRSLKLSNIRNGDTLGLTGFGGSGHLVLKLVKSTLPEVKVYVFARSKVEQRFALTLGAEWAGSAEERAPEACRAIIDTTPVWKPVVGALKNLAPGGRLVINAIRKEDHDKSVLENLDYTRDLWMEKEIKSVANVTGEDISKFIELAGKIPIRPEIMEYSLPDANRALLDLKKGGIRGAKVLRIA